MEFVNEQDKVNLDEGGDNVGGDEGHEEDAEDGRGPRLQDRPAHLPQRLRHPLLRVRRHRVLVPVADVRLKNCRFRVLW